MKYSRSMREIWEIKEKTGAVLEGKTDEEILAYFHEREPNWAKSLPNSPLTESTSTVSGRQSPPPNA